MTETAADRAFEKATDAMKWAEQAIHQVSTHEKECALRYIALDGSNKRVERSLEDLGKTISNGISDLGEKQARDIEGINLRFWWMATGLGGGMFAIIMALIFKH